MQTEDIVWLAQRKDWAGLRTVAMTRNTTLKNGVQTTETYCFISSLRLGAQEAARAIRGALDGRKLSLALGILSL